MTSFSALSTYEQWSYGKNKQLNLFKCYCAWSKESLIFLSTKLDGKNAKKRRYIDGLPAKFWPTDLPPPELAINKKTKVSFVQGNVATLAKCIRINKVAKVLVYTERERNETTIPNLVVDRYY